MSTNRQLFEILEDRVLLSTAGVEAFTAVIPRTDVNIGGTFSLPQFDTLNGQRTLLSAELTLEVQATGTSTLSNRAAQNPFGFPAVVTQWWLGENVSVSGALLNASVSPLAVGATDVPPVIGPVVLAVGQTQTLVLSETEIDSDVKTAATDDLSVFIGTGDITYTYTSSLIERHLGGPILQISVQDVGYEGVATVTYRYLDIVKGVVAQDSADVQGEFSPQQVAPAGVTVSPPGTPGFRFSGPITSGNLGTSVDSDLFGVRAIFGSRLATFAIVMSSGEEVFDAAIRDVLPASGYSIPAGGINLNVSYGNGAPIPAAADAAPGAVSYSLINGTLFGAAGGLRLNDPTGGAAISGLNEQTEVDGHNIVIVTYDLVVNQTFEFKTLTNTATWFNAALEEGGTDLTVTDPSDPATVTTVVLDDPWFRWHRFGTIEPYEPIHPRGFTPIFTGTAAPGSFISVELYNSRDELIGSTTVPVDAGGNWLANLPDSNIDQGPHNVVLRQTYPTYNEFADTGYNLRLYYQPAIMGGTYVSEYLTTENVLGIRSAHVSVNSLYLASMHPMLMGWNAYPYEQLPILQVQ